MHEARTLARFKPIGLTANGFKIPRGWRKKQLTALEKAQLPEAARTLDPATLSTYEAVRLFIARASAVRPGFSVTNENAPAVAAICVTTISCTTRSW